MISRGILVRLYKGQTSKEKPMVRHPFAPRT